MLGSASLKNLGLGTYLGVGVPGIAPLGPSVSPRGQNITHSRSASALPSAGPVDDVSLPPFFYEADPTDPMDVALLQELVALNLEVSARLNIKRVKQGEYEIESVRVSLYWQTAELFVRARRRKKGRKKSRAGEANEDETAVLDETDMPLATYLRQLANVENQPQQRRVVEPVIDAAAAAAAFASATGSVAAAGSFVSMMGATTPEMPYSQVSFVRPVSPIPSGHSQLTRPSSPLPSAQSQLTTANGMPIAGATRSGPPSSGLNAFSNPSPVPSQSYRAQV